MRRENEKVNGLCGTYIDDILRVGTEKFREISRKTNERFEMADDEELPFTFTGFVLNRDRDGTIILYQNDYLQKLTLLPEDASFCHIASIRMKLAWLAHSRPDCLFEVFQLTQLTKELFEVDRRTIVKRINKLIIYAKKNNVCIRFVKLDPSSFEIIGFSDASFAGTRDFTSQLGYIIFVSDKSGSVIPMLYKSYKARRVTRSVMGAEMIAFSDTFDAAFTLRKELEYLQSGTQIPIKLLTDSKNLFDVISKGTRTSEKRLMLDVACAREGFRNMEINDIGFIRSNYNLADGLTKSMKQAGLLSVMNTSRLDYEVDQWIIRDKTRK